MTHRFYKNEYGWYLYTMLIYLLIYFSIYIEIYAVVFFWRCDMKVTIGVAAKEVG